MILVHALRFLTENAAGGAIVPLLQRRDVDPQMITPLTGEHRRGPIAISAVALCSLVTTGTLIAFTTHRLIFWRRYFKTYIGYNQYVILIYNLLLADFQQALAFLLSLQWLAEDSVRGHTVVCFLQGWWLQVGDPGSGLFVLAIAVHTFCTVLVGRQLPHRWFVACIVGLWLFVAALVLIPTILHGYDTYSPAGIWVCLHIPLFSCRILPRETRTDQG